MTEHEADIAFLLSRAMAAGSADFTSGRWTGMSSNSIVAVAYGGAQENLPWDRGDYAACVRTVRRLPKHRRTDAVMEALKRAREAYLNHYPHHRSSSDRKAEREKWEQERKQRDKRRNRRRNRRRSA